MSHRIYIDVKDITKKYKTNEVLKGVRLNIRAGEIFGLLGPSGAGKTTLINILTGQLRQTDGQALILDTDTRKITRDVYSRLGMVLDNTGIYDRLTCRDNLSLFAELFGVPAKEADHILEKVGLAEAARRPAGRLSKGMKQRLAFARAVLHRPDILFLDEPTSGLDPQTASRIHSLILEEKKRGAAVFLTTHNMEEASKLCDNVALLHQGRIVEYGGPKEICRRYNHQNAIRLLLKSGDCLNFENNSSTAEEICGYLKEERVVEIHSSEPNLETVFMELTGRRFE